MNIGQFRATLYGMKHKPLDTPVTMTLAEGVELVKYIIAGWHRVAEETREEIRKLSWHKRLLRRF